MDKIAFIGGGNMAAGIIGGLIASGREPSRMTVVDPNADQRGRLTRDHGIHVVKGGRMNVARLGETDVPWLIRSVQSVMSDTSQTQFKATAPCKTDASHHD